MAVATIASPTTTSSIQTACSAWPRPGLSLDDDSSLFSLQGNWRDQAGRFYELCFHHTRIGSAKTPAGANALDATPVSLNLGEARIGLPWNGLRFNVAGRLQDDRLRPHGGLAAAVEIGLRANL